jgi:hypothetical protein
MRSTRSDETREKLVDTALEMLRNLSVTGSVTFRAAAKKPKRPAPAHPFAPTERSGTQDLEETEGEGFEPSKRPKTLAGR